VNSWPADTALLRTIIDRPDDDTPRLIYADWMEEQGQQPRAFALRDRQNALLRKYEKHWAKEFQPFVENWTFERGFIEYVALAASDFVAQGDFLFARAPICRMYLLGIGDLLPQIVQSPHLARLNTLYLGDEVGKITEHLVKSPYLEQVKELILMGNHFSLEEQRVLIGRFGDRIRF
jgi:uncharacterized protein (TIGR02996 family)